MFLSSSIAKDSDRSQYEMAKGLCYLSTATLEATQITFNKPAMTRAIAPPKPTSIFSAAPVAPEPDPVFVAPEPVVVATPAPVGVTKDVVLNVPVLVQEQLVSKKAEV